MDEIDRTIIRELQYGFPITDSPFAEVASRLGLSEAELLDRITRLREDNTLTRFGPMYQIERLGGAFSLAAMSVPAEAFDQIAEIVNQLPEIAHNYERNHELNMWFVIATESVEGVSEVVDKLEQLTGYKVFNMPKLEEYYVGLFFDL
ncbi:MAG: AsnC family transcriptional regulator [Hahellaceae bacterium]|nr:AsnC family transcriptional regulator [Hahellaceae bacterium]MCP5169697.1 AsnC family transcriptional regulator [Hahellaceae bacterium]